MCTTHVFTSSISPQPRNLCTPGHTYITQLSVTFNLNICTKYLCTVNLAILFRNVLGTTTNFIFSDNSQFFLQWLPREPKGIPLYPRPKPANHWQTTTLLVSPPGGSPPGSGSQQGQCQRHPWEGRLQAAGGKPRQPAGDPGRPHYIIRCLEAMEGPSSHRDMAGVRCFHRIMILLMIMIVILIPL